MYKNEHKQKLIDTLKEAPFVNRACKKVGIDHSTFYRWKKSSPKFSKDVEAAITLGSKSMSEIAEIGLFKKVKDGDMGAIRFALQNNDPKYMAKRTVYIPYSPPRKEHVPGDSCAECGHKPTSEEQQKVLEKVFLHYQKTAPKEYKENAETLLG